ncbi:hypothetical protein FHS76_001989 [Ochrobactrum daejeonense]|uniref:Uncharacterized protein n=1 Tax=Brucella daejeonensis TaxID=659015 RepID=A0A7W9AWX5_9HYPH|nr:hypothetical protein [Brucella daejeonensis]MBB5702114.1 hypothetical protein [Brucella daejeonensis]
MMLFYGAFRACLVSLVDKLSTEYAYPKRRADGITRTGPKTRGDIGTVQIAGQAQSFLSMHDQINL